MAREEELEAETEAMERSVPRSDETDAVVRVAAADGGRAKLLFPDFAMTSDRGRVLVEVVGYWTKEYLEDKRAMLNAARVPLVMCVDERRADAALAADPRVVLFKKRIDARAVLEACEQALGPLRADRDVEP